MTVDIINHYHNASRRLLLLDYDGTLVEFVPKASEARPGPEVLQVLAQLASDPANTVVIISGRTHDSLGSWLGHLPVALSAEHGLFTKQPGGDWELAHAVDTRWKPVVRRIMESVKIPGAEIEEKTMSLVWHYCEADPIDGVQAADGLAKQLVITLRDLPGLRLLLGHKVVEVTTSGTDKGLAARRWLSGDYDFILAAGDDTTDADMFSVLPPSAHAVAVREDLFGTSLTLPDPKAMLALLAAFPAIAEA